MNWPITIAVIVLIVAIAGYVLYRLCLASFAKSMESINLSREELEIGLLNRHHLFQDAICKVFSRNHLERFYGAEFDDAGDVVRITNQQAVLKGFVTDRVKLSEFSENTEMLRKALSIADPSYDVEYEGDLYIMELDCSDLDFRFAVPTHEKLNDPTDFVLGGKTKAGLNESYLQDAYPCYHRITEIKRVTADGGTHPVYRHTP